MILSQSKHYTTTPLHPADSQKYFIPHNMDIKLQFISEKLELEIFSSIRINNTEALAKVSTDKKRSTCHVMGKKINLKESWWTLFFQHYAVFFPRTYLYGGNKCQFWLPWKKKRKGEHLNGKVKKKREHWYIFKLVFCELKRWKRNLLTNLLSLTWMKKNYSAPIFRFVVCSG